MAFNEILSESLLLLVMGAATQFYRSDAVDYTNIQYSDKSIFIRNPGTNVC